MSVRAAGLFAAAALAEIGGVFLIWRAVRQGEPMWQAGAGSLLLAGYGFLATLQRDPHFGRVLAGYGGIFVAGSLLWGIALDAFHPSARDLLGASVCLIGVTIIMWSRP